MSGACLRGRSSAAGDRATAPRRRKIRRGTQSCWECKRRKTRCTFAAPTDAICDGCRSRRTRCIGQEFYDDGAPASRKTDRLSRVESLVEHLVRESGADMPDSLHQDQVEDTQQNSASVVQGTMNSDLPASATATTLNADHGRESQGTGNLDGLFPGLLEAWPKQHDLDLILSVPLGSSGLFHGIVCRPYSEMLAGKDLSPRYILQTPLPRSQPVLVARRLLLLAVLLQGIPPCSIGQLSGLSSSYRTIMSRAFDTATRLVTSSDELISSVEGVECVMIESMYLNDAGNLRRAWLTNRRAMSVAQMMGLHTGTRSPGILLDNETRERINTDYMWFRIVLSDRYLSLMLGLPQGSHESVFASPEALRGCASVERLERLESVAGGLILQRNSAEHTDLATTHKIDQMLRDAAELMPPQWWTMTSRPDTVSGDVRQEFQESVRLMNQFAYHHLLVQLHLPYMMLSSEDDPRYDYSKMTAAGASREIVARYVSFRNSAATMSYCRGIDFVAFIASTTLCVAHIEAGAQHRTGAGSHTTAFQSLRHRRLSDRGLLECTLEIIERMARGSSDAVAQKISSILGPLLAIESNSFGGSRYDICTSSEDETQDSHCLSDTSKDSHTLRIQIPYFGTIQIKHRPTLQILSEARSRRQAVSRTTDAGLGVLREPLSQRDMDAGERGSTTRRAGYEISATEPANTDWQAVPAYLNQASPYEPPESADWDQSVPSFEASGVEETFLLVPGLAADVDDWALQGVDMALFSSLAQDPTCPT